ncbi:DUF6296 family protein [Kitasatospora sp. NPDC058190]|uniref:DUF6296 family protein n=1 Tax=Kitasatospora sp. NPDC058190 TaxID=3346371 RepID=UPI0036DA7D23
MDELPRYAITLPGPSGSHGPPEVVLVQPTGEVTADGHPVYADDAGRLRVEIIGDVARPLTAGPGPGRHTCLHATALP